MSGEFLVCLIYFVVVFVAALSLVCYILKCRKKDFDKIGNWVYNFGPEFIVKDDGSDYYKFTTDFLTEYKKYTNEL